MSCIQLFRGFSFVDLVEHSRSHKLFALKRVLCHSKSDQARALKEAEYMRQFSAHVNIISLCGLEVVPVEGRSSSIISRIFILMPYCSVSNSW